MARTTTEHKIILKRASQLGVVRLEAVGTGSIMPGQLVEIEANEYLQKHSIAGGHSLKFFALPNPTPDTITYPTNASIDIPYDDGDTAYFMQGMPGDEVNAWLASGQNVKKGIDVLISDGNGRLTACANGSGAPGTSNPVAVAWEDVNANGGTAVRCRVRVI